MLSAFSLSRVGKKVIKDVNTLSAQAQERLIREQQRHDILHELKIFVPETADGEGGQQAIAFDPSFVETLARRVVRVGRVSGFAFRVSRVEPLRVGEVENRTSVVFPKSGPH